MSSYRYWLICALVSALAVAGPVAAAEPGPVNLGPVELVSRNSEGERADRYSDSPFLSADGRFVTFSSWAGNLVPGDTNGRPDAFVKDLATGAVERVSVDEQGAQLEIGSSTASISADGRYVLFSTAYRTTTSDGDVTATRWLVRDRAAGVSRPVEPRTSDGHPATLSGATLSGDGRFVALSTRDPLVAGDKDTGFDVYRLELATGALRWVSGAPVQGRGSEVWTIPSISHNGQVVSFDSDARLVRADRRRWTRDVYVRNLRQQQPRLMSVSLAGRQGNGESLQSRVSATGRYVVFSSMASNLVRRDTNRRRDVFIRDRGTGTTTRVSVDSRGRQGDRSVYAGSAPDISGDGRFVVFSSRAKLAAGAADDVVNVYLRDRQERTTVTVSTAAGGAAADRMSRGGKVSTDGSRVAFSSEATNLVDGETLGSDVFARELAPRS